MKAEVRSSLLKTLTLVPLLLALLVVPPSLAAQVKARQATPEEDPKQYFDSPMVLEIPLPDILAMPRGTFRGVGTDLRNYVSNDAHLASLVIQRGPDRGKGKKAASHLEFMTTVQVGSTRDKEVLLRLSFMKGDEEVVYVESKRFEAEEEKVASTRTKLRVPLAKLRRLYQGEPEPVLKVMMTVWDD